MGDPDKNGLKTAVDDYKKLERQKKPIVNCNIKVLRGFVVHWLNVLLQMFLVQTSCWNHRIKSFPF